MGAAVYVYGKGEGGKIRPCFSVYNVTWMVSPRAGIHPVGAAGAQAGPRVIDVTPAPGPAPPLLTKMFVS